MSFAKHLATLQNQLLDETRNSRRGRQEKRAAEELKLKRALIN